MCLLNTSSDRHIKLITKLKIAYTMHFHASLIGDKKHIKGINTKFHKQKH